MTSGKPGVLISSTFFDLRQIRQNLVGFIEGHLGYTALASELSSFPIDPDVDTIENCRRRVEQQADIMVLMIGTRYGYVDHASERSVTNLEYLAARAKNIPIYAFVEKRALALLDAWREGAVLERLVDTEKVFAFIDQVRSTDRVWTHGFETAEEVIEVLRAQFAFLQGEGLALRRRLREQNPLPDRYGLRGEAYRISIEKPRAWEYRLFAQVLIDGTAALEEQRTQHRLGIALGPGERLNGADVLNWYSARLEELQRTIVALAGLVNDTLPEAFGPPGKAGDEELIIICARQLIEIYRSLFDWSKRIRLAHTHERWHHLLRNMALFPNDAMEQVERLGLAIKEGVEAALALPVSERQPVRTEFKISLHNLQAVLDEMERIRREERWEDE